MGRLLALLAVSVAVLALTRCVYDFGYAHPLTEADSLSDYVGKNVTLRGRFGIRDEKLPPTVHFHGEVVQLEFHPALGLGMFISDYRRDAPNSRQPITVVGTLDKQPPGARFPFTYDSDRPGHWWQVPVHYCLRDAFWHDASEEGVSGDSSR